MDAPGTQASDPSEAWEATMRLIPAVGKPATAPRRGAEMVARYAMMTGRWGRPQDVVATLAEATFAAVAHGNPSTDLVDPAGEPAIDVEQWAELLASTHTAELVEIGADLFSSEGSQPPIATARPLPEDPAVAGASREENLVRRGEAIIADYQALYEGPGEPDETAARDLLQDAFRYLLTQDPAFDHVAFIEAQVARYHANFPAGAQPEPSALERARAWMAAFEEQHPDAAEWWDACGGYGGGDFAADVIEVALAMGGTYGAVVRGAAPVEYFDVVGEANAEGHFEALALQVPITGVESRSLSVSRDLKNWTTDRDAKGRAAVEGIAVVLIGEVDGLVGLADQVGLGLEARITPSIASWSPAEALPQVETSAGARVEGDDEPDVGGPNDGGPDIF